MSGFNGSGSFSFTYSWQNDAANGIPITASRMDTQFGDATNGFDLCLTRDGQGSASANLPMNGYIHTGVGTGTLANHYLPIGQLQTNVNNFSVAAGTAQAITATFTPPNPSLGDGMEHCVRALTANTGPAPTYAPDSLTAYPITKLGGVALLAGDISGQYHELRLRYNLANTRWELLNPAGSVTGGTFTPTDASGAGISFTGAIGVWTKSGNVVTVSGQFTSAGTASGANAVIGGLPFTAINSGAGQPAMNTIFNATSTANRGFVLANTTTFSIVGTSGNQLTNAVVLGATNYFSGQYISA